MLNIQNTDFENIPTFLEEYYSDNRSLDRREPYIVPTSMDDRRESANDSNYVEEYYDLNPNNKLDGSRTNVVTTMSKEGKLTAAGKNISKFREKNEINVNRKEAFTMSADPVPTSMSGNLVTNVDLKDASVQNPYGYGYIPSFNEAQLQDAQNILNQESSIFSIGAVAGVSLIVLSILITSTQNAAN